MNETLDQAEVKELTWGWWLVLLVGLLSMVAGVVDSVQARRQPHDPGCDRRHLRAG